MSASLPMITVTYAGVFGLLAVLLTVNVIVNRVRLRVNTGDGGKPQMAQAIRAHGNFAEHVPLALLLIGGTELSGYRAGIVIALGGVLLVARLLSAFGLNRSLSDTRPRTMGAGLTILVTAAASVLILWAAYAGR